MSLPIVYGDSEGDKARAILGTATHELGRYGYPCVDWAIWRLQQQPPNQYRCVQPTSDTAPLALESAEMDGVITRLLSSSLNSTSVMRLYDRLHELPVPSFVGQWMKLPCIIFKLGPLSASRNMLGHVFPAQTAVRVVEIKTDEDLSRFGSPYLIHPSIDFLLDRQPVRSVAETIPEENPNDRSSLIKELPLFSSPSGITSAAPQTRAARLVAHIG